MSAPTVDSSVFRVGEVVDGKYKIVRVLGRGGMGVVYEAHHELLAQPVALKVVLPEIASNHEVLSRFINEARNSAKIESDHVVRVMDVGRLESGAPFMVMELLAGEDLDATLAREGTLPASRIADLMLEALDGVASAHAIGIIHRDLKPGNLFLAQKAGRAPRLKVLDFGISKALGASQLLGAHVTRTTSIVGSPAYMSPEQLRSSKQIDARADIWSLGVILYQLATGSLPFTADNVGALFAEILETLPPPPRERRPDVSVALDQVIMRCLQKKPEDRYASALDLATALAPWGTTTAARALERIQGISSASIPPQGAAVPVSGAMLSSPPANGPEAFAATHLSDPLLEARVKTEVVASSPGGHTHGSWAQEGRTAPRPRSAVPIVLGGLALVAIVGLVIALRLFHGHGRGGAASPSAPMTSTRTASSETPTVVAPRAGADDGADHAAQADHAATAATASVDRVSQAASTASLALPSATASPRASKASKSSTGAKPAASDDLFGRF